MKTSKKQLAVLENAHLAAKKEYTEYLKEFNSERNIKGRTKIREIISMHLSGMSNKEIIEAGYNKHTVNDQVRLFVKGKKKVSTVVAKYISDDKPEVESDEESEGLEG